MWKRKSILLVTIWLISVELLSAAQHKDQPLTNQDIISMVSNHLPESVILNAIKSSDTNFDVSATALIALKKAGISTKLMEAMLAAVNNKKNPVVPASSSPGTPGNDPGAPSPISGPPNSAFSGGAASAFAGGSTGLQPAVSFVQGNSSVSLVAEATQIAQTKTKPTSLTALALDQALNEILRQSQEAAQQAILAKGVATIGKIAMGPSGIVLTEIMNRRKQMSTVTYVWAVPVAGSPAQASSNVPNINVNYAGLPGVNADAFEPVIVKLAPSASSFLLVGATQASGTAEQNAQQDWPIYSSFVEERVATKVQKLGQGRAILTPTAALQSGQYAIAMRPLDKSHKFSGEQVAKNQGEGLLFNYAWPFSVK
jgi:hypothetical protein